MQELQASRRGNSMASFFLDYPTTTTTTTTTTANN
jgi:hypothetical protein